MTPITERTPAPLSQSRLEAADDEDCALIDVDRADAEANERVCNALIALRERKKISFDAWAKKLGLDQKRLRLIEEGRVLDQPSASLLLRAALLVHGELKIAFGSGKQAMKV